MLVSIIVVITFLCLVGTLCQLQEMRAGSTSLPYDSTGTEFIGIQVKALSKRNPVPLGADLEKIMSDFWIIVISLAQKPTAFIMKPTEVKERAHRGEKDGRVSFWLQPTAYDQPFFREAWERLPNVSTRLDEGSLQ
jgi:hypothetical protein